MCSVSYAVECMDSPRRHNQLGHLSFLKLKQLALNGKISKKLAHVTSPKCACYLCGMMTKLPWRSKESISSHKVFVATKLGETVSVNQMTLTMSELKPWS